MPNDVEPTERRKATDFERQAEAQSASAGPIREFWYYLRHSRKWWIAPIIVSLLMIGSLIILGGTSVAPLIYTLF